MTAHAVLIGAAGLSLDLALAILAGRWLKKQRQRREFYERMGVGHEG